MHFNRREALLGAALATQLPASTSRLDQAVQALIDRQNVDPKSRWYGGIPDGYGLHNHGSAVGLFETLTTAYVLPGSKFHRNALLRDRIQLGAAFLDRHMTPDGNINLLITNFNSPPDGAFAVRTASVAARLARQFKAPELGSLIEPFLKRQGEGLIKGGIHTPNHRWVMCAALACLDELFPADPRYRRRAAQWLAEGIDIDADGQYTERSSGTYNIVVNQSLVTIADKLARPDLLDAVRRNLASVFKLMDHGDELVTDISTRQDKFTKVDVGGYWYPLAYLAWKDANPVYAHLARKYADRHAPTSYLLLEPKLALDDARTQPPEDNYRHVFPGLGVARIRRGSRSATIFGQRSSRFLAVRHGDAVLNTVRFATGFFGKGQFVPAALTERDGGFHLTQTLSGPYFQPFENRSVGMDFDRTRRERRQTEVCTLTQSATIYERDWGIELLIEANGTDEVPILVELNFREGGRFEGEGLAVVDPAPESRYLHQGFATYSAGSHRLRVGPGFHEHRWIDVRGAEPRLPGSSLLLTGYTPFRQILRLEWT